MSLSWLVSPGMFAASWGNKLFSVLLAKNITATTGTEDTGLAFKELDNYEETREWL